MEEGFTFQVTCTGVLGTGYWVLGTGYWDGVTISIILSNFFPNKWNLVEILAVFMAIGCFPGREID